MWYQLGKFILKNRVGALLLLLVLTCVMGYYAIQVKLSYDFTRAVPVDNPKMLDYQAFLKKFGADGNTMVIGVQTDQYFKKDFFNGVAILGQELKKIPGVIGILSIPEVVTLAIDSSTQKFGPLKVFHYPYTNQLLLDTAKSVFESLRF